MVSPSHSSSSTIPHTRSSLFLLPAGLGEKAAEQLLMFYPFLSCIGLKPLQDILGQTNGNSSL